VNAIVMSLAAIPTYFLARMFVTRRSAVAVAVLSIAIPGMSYAASIVPEVLAYPWYALSSWLIVRCLARRGLLDYALAVAACVVAGLIRWPQFATVPAAFLISLGALWVIGPRGRALRAGWSRGDHFAAIILAQHLKLDPDKDIQLVPGGPDAERLAAMSAGKIDAGVFNSSSLPIAKRMGLVELVRIPDLKVEVQGNGMATTRSYIKSNREVVKSALKGYIEGINFIFSNKQATQKVFGRYMRTSDAEVLETSYQAYINTTPRKPYPTLKGLQFLLDRLAPTMPQAKTAKPEQFVDMSFLQELEKENFFNEMAKRYPGK